MQVAEATAADVVVVVLGENHFAEFPGNLRDLALPAGQIAFVDALIATGTPVVAVLVQARPRILNSVLNADAIVNGVWRERCS